MDKLIEQLCKGFRVDRSRVEGVYIDAESAVFTIAADRSAPQVQPPTHELIFLWSQFEAMDSEAGHTQD